jgi:nucleotide-binding universal stress UspA family protein
VFKKIALAHDGSVHAERALAYATALAEREEAPLVIVHVDEQVMAKGGGPLLADETEILAEIKRIPERLAKDGVDATVRVATVRTGGPAPAIVKIADEEGADVIVAGSTGLSSLSGLLLGSVTHKLLHLAKQPILVITPESKLEQAGTTNDAATTASA